MALNNGGKKGLDPLVECSEAVDMHEMNDEENGVIGCDAALLSNTLEASTSKSSETVENTVGKTKNEGKRRRTGSRLSLASLFSFSSQGGREKEAKRERSRSRWSCGEGEPSEEVMSSISIGDLRSTGSTPGTAAGGNRRFRGHSDAGSGEIPENPDAGEALLLVETDQEDEELGHGKKRVCSRGGKSRECPLCCVRQPVSRFPRLVGCSHRSCRACLQQYIEMEIMENRVEVSCPECPNHLHPADIKNLVSSRSFDKYEQFSLRRYLLTEPDARWCPAPDCNYAVIATSCAACPQLKCPRDSCGALFCYHCKGAWHASQTCDEARRVRGGPTPAAFRSTNGRRITSASIDAQLRPGDMKACPRCHTYIVKMDDGSCNHMVCAMCSAEFCWLCLKEISDLHYLSPTGCTFWGKKPWTRKKKLLWQVGTLIGAPVGIALIAGLSIPGIIFGVPVFVGRKVHQRFLHLSSARRRLVTAACVAGSLVVSPVLAVMAVGVGVPIMLAYVYGVVPLSLCRNGGCGLSESSNPADSDPLEEEEIWREAGGLEKSQLLSEADRQLDGTSIAPGISIQSESMSTSHVRLAVHHSNFSKRARSPSVSSGSGRMSPDARYNYEEASTKAMAGSQYHFYYDDKSVHTMYSGQEVVSYSEEVASTKALAGSVHDSKSLSDSTGRHQHRHEHGCDEVQHASVCPTPSTSSAEHSKWSVPVEDPCPSSSRRRIEGRTSMPRTVNIAAIVHPTPSGNGEDLDSIDIESQSGPARVSTNSGASGSLPGPAPRSSTNGGPSGSQPSSAPLDSSRDEADPFKIRALLDNMKQMVAADVPLDRPYEPSSSSARPPAVSVSSRIRRSGSGKSLMTVATHSSAPEAAQLMGPEPSTSSPVVSSSSKQKRGFFSSLFGRKKK